MLPPPALTDRIANSFVPRLTEWILLLVLACCTTRLRAGEDPLRVGPPTIILSGTPEEIGTAEGTAFRAVIPGLLRVMGLGAQALQTFKPRRVRSWIAGLPPAHRAELEALAVHGGCPLERLLRTNVIVDTCCSALVSPATAGQPLMVARNMDFFPAGVTGPGTVLKLYRPAGRRAFASVSWPGYAGVVSGMNDAGLVACVLLRHAGSSHDGGMPMCFRMREILEDCADLEQAVRRFADPLPSADHYLLLADAHGTALLWRQGDRIMRHDPQHGWLAADNGRRALDGTPAGRRAMLLQQLAAGAQGWDEGWMRSATTATCQLGTNAQAMLWTPATRSLDLALGTGTKAAAFRTWVRFDLADALAGRSDAIPRQVLGPVRRLPHYLRSDPYADLRG
jgi:hypothetical protein